MEIALRPATPEDESFLFRLYASTREEELAPFGWNAAQLETFLHMQYTAQRRWYEMAYVAAEHSVILRDGQAVGRLMVLRDPDAVRLVDISLLTEERGKGIGVRLVGDLVQEGSAKGVPVRLQVLKSNRARRLYERLGFVITGEDGMYYQMECPTG